MNEYDIRRTERVKIAKDLLGVNHITSVAETWHDRVSMGNLLDTEELIFDILKDLSYNANQDSVAYSVVAIRKKSIDILEKIQEIVEDALDEACYNDDDDGGLYE